MSPIKGIEIQFQTGVFGIGLVLALGSGECGLFSIILGPLIINVNRPQYFKNGFFSFERV